MKRLQEQWTTEEFEELEELAYLVGEGYGLLDNGDGTISVYKDADYSYGDQPDRERDNLPTFKTIGECAEYLNNILLDYDEDSFDESLNKQKEDTKNMKEVLKNNKPLKEESNIDKINRYLVSIGEAPLTEEKVVECDKSKKPVIEEGANPYDKIMDTIQKRGTVKKGEVSARSSKPAKFKSDDNPYDKLKKYFKDKADVDLDECGEPMKECKKPVTESVKKVSATKVGRPGSLMESMNRGFAKLYGDFDDSKSLNESYKKSKK